MFNNVNEYKFFALILNLNILFAFLVSLFEEPFFLMLNMAKMDLARCAYYFIEKNTSQGCVNCIFCYFTSVL